MSSGSGRVLVLGDDTRAFLTVVRSLGSHGLEVHVAWCPLDSPALRSKYVHTVHRLPEYRAANRRWLEALQKLLRDIPFDLVIPCHDSGLLPLQEQRAELEPLARVALINDEAFRIFFSKRRTYDFASELGVALPRQRVVHSMAEVEAAIEEFGLPLVLKPQSSAAIDNPWSRLSVRKIKDRAALPEIASLPHLSEGILAQENFRGVGVGVEVLCRDGEILTAFQHLRVHEPLHGGGSSYRKSVALDPGLLDASRKLMTGTRYTGVAMVEFKVNPQSGKWILIEVNPRFWGSLPLTVAAGLDFPQYLYDMMLGAPGPFPQNYRRNFYARNWHADLYWLKADLEADRSDPDLMTLPLGTVAREIFHLLSLRESNDTLTLDDPKPFFAEFGGLVSERAHAWLQRTGWRRRRLHNQAEAAVRKARRVLFLCHGNICRSPFAEYALRKLNPSLECASTGYHSVDARCCPSTAVAAAASLGIDLSGHRVEKPGTPGSCLWADVIGLDSFDRKQTARLAAVYPEALPKSHYLGALDSAGPLETADPYGLDAAHFGNTYRTILGLLQTPGFRAD